MNSAWILDDFSNALRQLEDALSVPASSNLIRAGCIQYFEFCFELAWKSIKIVSGEMSLPECLSPKACLKQAFSQGWVGDEDVWLAMLAARNRMSHTYDANEALNIYGALAGFLLALKSLQESLRRATED